MICGSCKRIPTEAVMCKEDDCEQYFCSPCVLHIAKLNGPCPMPDCQKTLYLKKPGKIAAEGYKEMRFKCADCDSLYTYNDHSGHKAYCLLRAHQCIFQCGDGKTYKSRGEHSDHVKQDCQAVPLVCIRCQARTTRAEYPAHDCIPGQI